MSLLKAELDVVPVDELGEASRLPFWGGDPENQKEYTFFVKFANNTLFMKVQVNLFQKHLFLHQLNHNMTKYCSWIYHENYKHRTLAEHGQNMFCTCIFASINPQYDSRLFMEYHEKYMRRTWAEHVLPMFCQRSVLVVFMVIP